MLNSAHKIDNAPFYQQADMVNQINVQSWAKLGKVGEEINNMLILSKHQWLFLPIGD
jgi:hypothetical protein